MSETIWTSMAVRKSTLERLDKFLEKRESYDAIVNKIIDKYEANEKRLEPLDELCLQRCRGNAPKKCSGNPYDCEKEATV